MQQPTNYFDFLSSHGKPLAEINPGSDEIALSVEDATKALELLEGSQEPILGGDILSIKSGKLSYIIHFWGDEHHYLNWYCEQEENENRSEYCKRSYTVALNGIQEANKVAQKLNQKCYVVFII